MKARARTITITSAEAERSTFLIWSMAAAFALTILLIFPS